ncbi:MAG: hypothetical protein IT580_00505, partial [Verrucomicrobiales bacterium]|nr:hypothetical protein [Verrucomicrobiales bacterium]
MLQATLYAELPGSESVSIRTVAGHQDHLYVALTDARGHERIDVWNTRLPHHPRLTSSLDFGSLLTNGVMFTPLALHPHDRGLLLQTRRGLAHYLLDASGRLDFEHDLPPTLTGLGLGMTQLHIAGRHASLLQQVVPSSQITGDPGQRVHQQVLIDLAQPDSPRLLWGGPQGWSVQDEDPVSQLFGGNPASLHFDSGSPQVRLRVFEPRREAHRQTFWQPKLERVVRGDALQLPLRELLSRSIPTHKLAEWQTLGLSRSIELQGHPQRTLGSLILERFPPEERLSAVLDQLGLSPDLPLETALAQVISDRLNPEHEAALSEEWFSPPLRLWLENILGPDLHQATTSETRARIAGAFHADLTEESFIRQLTLEVIAPLIGNPAFMQWTLRELIEAMAHSAPGELVTLTLRTCGGFGTLNTLLDGLDDLLDWVPGLQLPSCARYPESASELIHLALFSWNDASTGRHLNPDGYAWFELLKFHRYLSGRPDLAGYQREVQARLEAMQRSLGENLASRLAPALDLGLSDLPLPKAHAAAARRLPSGLLYGRLVARGLLALMPERAGIDGAMTVRQALSHWGLRLDAPGQTGSSLAELLLSLDAIQLSERTTLELLASASHLPTADFHTHLEQVLRREIQNAFHFSDLDTPLQQLLEPVLDFDVDLQNVLGDWMSGLLHETLVSGSALPQQFLTLRRAFQQQDCIAQWLVTLDAVSLAASWIGLAEIPVALEFALREAYQAGVGYLVETMFGTLISEIVEGCS